MLEEGKSAPKFKLPADDGTIFDLAKEKGQPVVIYFYPKDDTSGCTLEAQDFTHLAPEFAAAGVSVVGISPDSVKKHEKFKTKHNLTVKLLADEEKTVCERYGVWVEKSMYGRKYMGVERSTFLIDAKGRLARIWRKVKVKSHAEEVLGEAKQLT